MSAELAPTCFHCGEPVAGGTRFSLRFEGAARALCCAGCEAVARTIVDAGLGDYYRHREAPAALGAIPDDLAQRIDALAVYDEPEVSGRFVRTVKAEAGGTGAEAGADGLCEVDLAVEGMHCGACVWLLERTVRAQPGVTDASFNFSSERARLRFDPSRTRLSSLLRAIARLGYRAAPFDASTREAALKRQSRVMLQRLFVAGLGMMQVMMYAYPAYVSGAGELDADTAHLLRWASLVLTTPVMLYSAQPFLQGAWRDIKSRSLGMDVPVSLALVAAFAASCWATVTRTGEAYFDSVTMFVFLLLAARWLEWTARRRAMRALDTLSAAGPDLARRVVLDADGCETFETVPAARLLPGDIVEVDNGERVPADAVLVVGRTAVDQSLLTGESLPIAVNAGGAVPGGALLAGARARLRIEKSVSDSALSTIERLIERGAADKPRLVVFADRIAAHFVALLLIFAAAVWFTWMAIDPSRAWPVAIAVLVVSCPCALSLATPAALAAATGALLRDRLLITRGHALEALARTTDVVLDKTGTLTEGRPKLAAVDLAPGWQRSEVLAVAAALERGSSHPLARAIIVAAEAEQAGMPDADAACSATAGAALDRQRPPSRFDANCAVTDLRDQAGLGVSGVVAGRAGTPAFELRLGSAAWCALSADTTSAFPDPGAASVVWLSRREGDAFAPIARFAITDPLREDAATLVRSLQAHGLRVHLLSGDRIPAVESVAHALGIEHRVGQASPTDKQAYVRALQAGGACVTMVGDGINDAPVLAASDVSVAVGQASALAQCAADAIVLSPGIAGVDSLLMHARSTLRTIRQNLTWAATYNLTAIPLAALGLVPPWAAAIGMAASSLLVAGNALRLLRRPVRSAAVRAPAPLAARPEPAIGG